MFTNIISTSRSNIKFKVKQEDVIGRMKSALRPWEHFVYSPEKEQAMYVEWGTHCAWKQENELAETYYNRALDIRTDDAKALYSRSHCRRSLAETLQAFDDSLKATYLQPLKPNINEEFCCTIYELNEFEATMGEAYGISQRYGGPYRKKFEDFCHVTKENIKDSLGDSVGYFLTKHNRLCDLVLEEYKRKNTADNRPLWKILREQKKCDVLSITEKNEVLVHPLEQARRDRALTVFYQKYLHRSWIDVAAIRKFSKNKKLLAMAFKESTPKLEKMLETKNKAIRKFAKMLHARSPLYNEFKDKNTHKSLWKQYRESILYRIQYQTRRSMYHIIRNLRYLTEIGPIEKLSQYVEKAMGDYIIIKTLRIAPWKFEFLNDVYNTLALAYADLCIIPPDFNSSSKDAWEKLLRLPPPIDYVIGERDSLSLTPSEKKERDLSGYKLFLMRMEKRLYFAKYSIEKAYIYHEVARAHFKANHMNDCTSTAQRGLQVALECNHGLWAFLCAILSARAQAYNFKIDKSLHDLTKASYLAEKLKSNKLVDYTDLAKSLNEMKIAEQRSSAKEMERRTRGKGHLSVDSLSTTTNLEQQSVHSQQDRHSTSI